MTTRQFAELCRAIIAGGHFDALAAVASIRHFCPNRPLSKFELLERFNARLGSPVEVVATQADRPVNRVLRSRFEDLVPFSGSDLDIADAIDSMLSPVVPTMTDSS